MPRISSKGSLFETNKNSIVQRCSYSLPWSSSENLQESARTDGFTMTYQPNSLRFSLSDPGLSLWALPQPGVDNTKIRLVSSSRQSKGILRRPRLGSKKKGPVEAPGRPSTTIKIGAGGNAARKARSFKAWYICRAKQEKTFVGWNNVGNPINLPFGDGL